MIFIHVHVIFLATGQIQQGYLFMVVVIDKAVILGNYGKHLPLTTAYD